MGRTSPPQGGDWLSSTISPITIVSEQAPSKRPANLPLEGEMAAKRPEGVRAAVLSAKRTLRPAERTPPGRFAVTLPSRGRGSSALRLLRRLELGRVELVGLRAE